MPARRPRRSTAARGYGSAHQRLRRRVSRLVVSGEATCTRCGEKIEPGSAWDLDHTDNRRGYLGPAHRSCNRRNGRGAALLEDDPAGGIYWGPPDERGHQLRWSRPWYDWRAA
jgi:hypothetical protein